MLSTIHLLSINNSCHRLSIKNEQYLLHSKHISRIFIYQLPFEAFPQHLVSSANSNLSRYLSQHPLLNPHRQLPLLYTHQHPPTHLPQHNPLSISHRRKPSLMITRPNLRLPIIIQTRTHLFHRRHYQLSFVNSFCAQLFTV